MCKSSADTLRSAIEKALWIAAYDAKLVLRTSLLLEIGVLNFCALFIPHGNFYLNRLFACIFSAHHLHCRLDLALIPSEAAHDCSLLHTLIAQGD